MTLRELISEFRVWADDTAQPYLWPDARVVGWFKDAEEQACRRAELLVDSSTGELVTATALADEKWISLDPRVVRVMRARPTGRRPLPIIPRAEMDRTYAHWEDETGTDLVCLVPDMETRKLRVYPIPTADVTVNLTIQRLPLEPLTRENLDAEPEIDPTYHIKLVHWVMHRAFATEDSDTQDVQKSAVHEREFSREFGPDPSAKGEVFMRAHGGHDWTPGDFA